jgi:L-ascorbate metabolism protein UlaG (beta-lactamase superfamily)
LRDPTVSENLKPRRISPSFFEQRQDTLITWLGMAGVLINARGTILFIDPLITVARSHGQLLCEAEYRLKIPLPIQARDVPQADAVLYSHADNDHLGRLTARTFASQLPCRFLAPPPVGRILRQMGVAGERIATAQEGEPIQVGCAQVVVTPALHDWQEENPWKRGDCCGYLVRTPDGTIWHPGDTRLIAELLAVKGVDVLFFDVAAVDAHLGPAGSARLAESCGARVAIAYHYGTFDLPAGTFGGCTPEDCLPYVDGMAARFLQLNPGEPLRLPLDT